MKFRFSKPECQNIREALTREWLLTNGVGDYASSTILCCNTRKYHGLLVANLEYPQGRHVLLSTIEESVLAQDKEFPCSCRKHPDVFYPRGHEYLDYVATGDWPIFHYRIGPLSIKREFVLVRGRTLVLLRYTVTCDGEHPPLKLQLKPLLAYRDFHSLSHNNMDLQTRTWPAINGCKVQPYTNMPPLYMQVDVPSEFFPSPDWFYNVEYPQEIARGFDGHEDLFMPGIFEVPLEPGTSIILSASTEEVTEDLAALWTSETQRRLALTLSSTGIQGQLEREGARYLVSDPRDEMRIIAGYHWFDSWGRDSMISLPGLTFCSGRMSKGERLLRSMTEAAPDGLIPNMFSTLGDHAYNSVDASLWYVWAVQQMEVWATDDKSEFIKEVCWPMIRKIIDVFLEGRAPHSWIDKNGLLHAGNENSQLTWMDAQVHGKPVTPRHGCPVEINALWYNTLCYADELARRYGEAPAFEELSLRLRHHFNQLFWIEDHNGYLADVWREDYTDTRIRPNQIFAVSMPYSMLDEERQSCVVECVRNKLLSPYGLYTLAPDDDEFECFYEGPPEKRDRAYHQGTIWPWLLGGYADALLRVAWDTEGAAQALLDHITPLYTKHLREAGLGTMSEIFEACAPHKPNGCIAQAWSVAEALRLLKTVQKAAPQAYAQWERAHGEGK